MTRNNYISRLSIYIFIAILILKVMVLAGDPAFAEMPYYTPSLYTITEISDNAFFLAKKEKKPTKEQLKAGKGLGLIQWSKKTGGPRDIQGHLTPPSTEDRKTIAWRFLKEKKPLYGMQNPVKDLRLKTFINGRYDTTIHFQQVYENIPVEAYLVVSILPNGVIHSVSGEYYPELEVDLKPAVSGQRAREIGSQYGQEHDPGVRKLLDMPDSTAPELLIRPSGDKAYLLWYLAGQGGWKYYIDAHDETIRNVISPVRNSFEPVEGKTLATKDLPNGAVVPFHLNADPNNPRISWWWDPNWGIPYLFEDDLSTGTTKVMVYDAGFTSRTKARCEQCDIYSCCMSNPNCTCPINGCCSCSTAWCIGDYPTILANIGPDIPSPMGDASVSAIYYTGKVYEFYKENFGLDGYKGDGTETRVVVNYWYLFPGGGHDPSMASYNSFVDTIAVGSGCGSDPNCLQLIGYKNLAGSLDTIAHEYTHAVQCHSEVGELLQGGENGALAESFADTMACAVEYWVANTAVDASGSYVFENSFDYEFEEDVRTFLDPNGKVKPTRSLQDPHASNPPQPDTYQGTYWDANNYHNMCGVPNKMFYLLSEGGEHNGITVTGIGADGNHVLNAAKVMYLAATEKWIGYPDFAAAREKCILAAKALDNEHSSHWAYSVANAWAAVGVGDPVAGDVFEPDNSQALASSIDLFEQQTHFISPASDHDWLTFTLNETTLVWIITSGPSGDTQMWLRDAQGTEIEFDDDGSGEGYFSKIERELGAGTYYIEISTDPNNSEEIPYYYIDLIDWENSPDLTIQSISAWDYYYGYPYCRVGWPVVIRVNTKNEGNTAAGTFQTGLYVNDVYQGYWNISSLSAHTSTNRYAVRYFWEAGWHYIDAEADKYDSIMEKDEDNNWYGSISFYIYP